MWKKCDVPCARPMVAMVRASCASGTGAALAEVALAEVAVAELAFGGMAFGEVAVAGVVLIGISGIGSASNVGVAATAVWR
jgi:hypothetical protein